MYAGSFGAMPAELGAHDDRVYPRPRPCSPRLPRRLRRRVQCRSRRRAGCSALLDELPGGPNLAARVKARGGRRNARTGTSALRTRHGRQPPRAPPCPRGPPTASRTPDTATPGPASRPPRPSCRNGGRRGGTSHLPRIKHQSYPALTVIGEAGPPPRPLWSCQVTKTSLAAIGPARPDRPRSKTAGGAASAEGGLAYRLVSSSESD
jgi:hypothetical protein